MFLDATYLKGRVDHQVVSRAVVVATGVTMDGHREVLGCAVGDSEDGAFWTSFLRSLRARGLSGVRLVISDQHLGLKAAVEAVMVGSAWQRCRVHFMRNVLTRVKRDSTPTWSSPPSRRSSPSPTPRPSGSSSTGSSGTLGAQFPDVATMLDRRQRGPPRLQRLPRGPLAEGLVDQPARAPPPGDQAPHRRGRGLPERRGRRAPGHRGGRRDPRRVAGGRAALPVGDLDGPALRRREAIVERASEGSSAPRLSPAEILASGRCRTVLPELDVEKVRRFCRKKVPDTLADEVRLEVTTRGKSVSIHERRPRLAGRTRRMDVHAHCPAPLRGRRARGRSTSVTAYGKWIMYFDLDPKQPVDVLINELEDDPTCVFWG